MSHSGFSSNSSRNNHSSSKTSRPLLKRVNHNELERKRRQHQKDKLDELKDLLPGLQMDKPSVVAIIQKAKEHILELRAINVEQAQIISVLRKKNPSLSIPGPNFMPHAANLIPMGGEFGMAGMPMLGHPGMYPAAMNSMMMLPNPMSMNPNFKNHVMDLEKARVEHHSAQNKVAKEIEGDGKTASPGRQPPSQRSSGSDGIPSLQKNEMDWSSGMTFDPSMMGFDPNSGYLRKHRSVVDQDFDVMKRALNDRRDSFAAMFEASSRPSDPNIIPINPYHKESIAALYNYGFYNADDKETVS